MVDTPHVQPLELLALKLQKMHAARNMLLTQSQLADLEAATRIVQQEYNTAFNKTSTIETLPDDIISIIFEQVHQSNDKNSCQVLAESQVTRRWRGVAIDTPKLWSTLYLSVHQLQSIDLVDLYLSRSKSIPSDLTIKEVLLREKSLELDCVAAFGDLLRDHIHRCRHFYCEIVTMECIQAILDPLVLASAPLLESFDVHMEDFSSNSLDTTNIFMGGTPMLAVVQLRDSPGYLPPFHSVTNLHLYNFKHDITITPQN